MWNKLRLFFNLAPIKEIYIFEDGKDAKKATGLQIWDTMFKEAIKLVMNKHLDDIEFWRNISSLREQSKSQLQELLQHQLPNADKKENVEYQAILSGLSQNLSDIKLEQSHTTKKSLENQAMLSDMKVGQNQTTNKHIEQLKMLSEIKLEQSQTTKKSLEHQAMLSELSQNVSDLRSELSQISELLLEIMKNGKYLLEKQQDASDPK